MVVELAPPLPVTAAGLFSPSLMVALILFAPLQTESPPFYDVLFDIGQKVFAIVSTFVELPWKKNVTRVYRRIYCSMPRSPSSI